MLDLLREMLELQVRSTMTALLRLFEVFSLELQGAEKRLIQKRAVNGANLDPS